MAARNQVVLKADKRRPGEEMGVWYQLTKREKESISTQFHVGHDFNSATSKPHRGVKTYRSRTEGTTQIKSIILPDYECAA